MSKTVKIWIVVALLIGGAIAVYFLWKRGKEKNVDAEDMGNLWGGDGIGFAGFVNLFKSRKDAVPNTIKNKSDELPNTIKNNADTVPFLYGYKLLKSKADKIVS